MEKIEFEGMNPNPTFSKTKEGPIHRISFEVDEDVWNLFKHANTRGMIVSGALQVIEGSLFEEEVKSKIPTHGDFAKELFLSDFFRTPKVWEMIGTDRDFLKWLLTQPCAAKHISCEGDLCAAHVRRIANGAGVGIKPIYSAIPLCFKAHSMQHQIGESAIGDKEWWDKQRIEHVHRWARETLRNLFGYGSWREFPPHIFLKWCEEKNLINFLNKKILDMIRATLH